MSGVKSKGVGFLFMFNIIFSAALYEHELSLECTGKTYKNVTLTAYYPDFFDEDHEGGYLDKKGQKLRSLQDYIDNRADYVTLSMDNALGIPYGTPVCIPELNQHYGHKILLQVRDSSFDMFQSGYTRADICVRSDVDSYDRSVNREVTLIFTKNI
ncbi:uncharacterized protein LOC108917074 [Anoplophora glabripennis]|uniref:uncharacterized protein LOC108917074 n=1 Tax=Anoplophora glabripennis TaxID=217634 RepID=UPI0008753B0D|nr:uncharacterized protein LOC108917074 [Anoplophora glabripennis]